jgi:hypothetical protein
MKNAVPHVAGFLICVICRWSCPARGGRHRSQDSG